MRAGVEDPAFDKKALAIGMHHAAPVISRTWRLTGIEMTMLDGNCRAAQKAVNF
jgi:hypothetical protein